jgi:hypothetical protein
VLAEANWQPRQQSSFESSQTALLLNLQVLGSQHLLLPQPADPPQSHCSSPSTIPLPQVWPVMVPTPLLFVRHADLTLLRPRAEHTLPMEQAEKRVMPFAVDGFMMKPSPALQVPELRGQHC